MPTLWVENSASSVSGTGARIVCGLGAKTADLIDFGAAGAFLDGLLDFETCCCGELSGEVSGISIKISGDWGGLSGVSGGMSGVSVEVISPLFALSKGVGPLTFSDGRSSVSFYVP